VSLVERSDPEFERDDESDDIYPPAPLPPHERVWRHPSELGEASWVLSEPPMAVGRGLFTAAATVGGLLSIAVMWLMLSASGGGEEGGVADGPSSLFTNTSIYAAQTSRLPEPRSSSTTTARLVTTTAAVTSTTISVASTRPRISPPPQTVSTSQTTAPAPNVETEGPPVAVALASTSGADFDLVVTTARAVSGKTRLTVTVQGQPMDGAVITTESGIAVLAVADSIDPAPYTVTDMPGDGQNVRVLATNPVLGQLTLANGAFNVTVSVSMTLAEGTPVVDAAGALIGLSTVTEGRVGIVPIGGATALMTKAETMAAGPGWTGLEVNADDSAPAAITALIPDGPAALAGLLVGDVIVQIGDTPTPRAADVRAALDTCRPGKNRSVQVQRADGTSLTVTVAFGVKPGT
jgi:hypothetical protein